MLKKNLKTLFVILLLTPFSLVAEFDLQGEITLVDPYNRTTSKPMSIAYSEETGQGYFSIGGARFKVSSQPEKYSVALVLQANNYVWIQEFSKRPIKTFEWKIADHTISLNKAILEKPVKGDYILTVDENDYFFSKKLAQITFTFNDESGLEGIEVDGMTMSLGLNKAKSANKCEEKTDDSEAADKCADKPKDNE